MQSSTAVGTGKLRHCNLRTSTAVGTGTLRTSTAVGTDTLTKMLPTQVGRVGFAKAYSHMLHVGNELTLFGPIAGYKQGLARGKLIQNKQT